MYIDRGVWPDGGPDFVSPDLAFPAGLFERVGEPHGGGLVVAVVVAREWGPW